jgi:RecA-family ATPase
VQIQNFKRDGANVDAKIAAILDRGRGLASPVEAVGEIARAMICAAPGFRLMIADFSGIESRVLAWISGQQSKVDAWSRFDRTGAEDNDPYRIIGRRCGLPEDIARITGKIIDLAFGFGGGPGAWEKAAPEDDTTPEATVQRYCDTWRAEHPATRRFWYALNDAAVGAVRRTGTEFRVGRITARCDGPHLRITLPSGRPLSYPFCHIGTGRFGHASVVFEATDNNTKQWTEYGQGFGAWHGTLIENVVQAIARDLLAAAMVRLEAAGYPIIFTVHDEIVVEVPESFGSLDEFKQLMTALPDWAAGLPIAAKAREARRFSKPEATKAPASAGDDATPQVPSPPLCPDTAVADEARQNARSNPPEDAAADAPPTQDEAPRMREDDNDGHTGEQSNEAPGNDATAPPPNTDPELGPYIYRNTRGGPHAKVIRTPNGKNRFAQQHWTGTAWASGETEHKLPYRLPELLAADPEEWVCITEGEKDAVNVAKLGIVATTNPNGAKGWNKAKLVPYFAHLRRIAILEDNDPAGRERTKRIVESLRTLDPSPDIRVVSFSELAEGEDVSDWLAQERGRGRSELLARIEAAAPHALAPLPFLDMSRWDDEEPPPREWALYDRIPLRQTSLFSGEGGGGKSRMQLHQCAAHVLAREWLGMDPAPGAAIFVDAEDDRDELRRRLRAVLDHYGATHQEAVRGGLHLISLTGEDAVLATCSKGGKIEPTPRYAQLLEAASDIKPKMIGIASSADVFAGSEIDRSQVQQFIGLLTRMAIRADGAVQLISHPSLTGINSDTGLSGSTQWHNSVRARSYLKSVKPENGEQPETDLRELVFKKNNYGPVTHSIVLRYQDGLYLPVPGVASLDQAAQEAVAQAVFLDLLARFTRENRNASDRTGKAYAPALFSGEDEATRARVTKRALEAAMRQLFKAGKIWNEPCGKPSRPQFRLAVKG